MKEHSVYSHSDSRHEPQTQQGRGPTQLYWLEYVHMTDERKQFLPRKCRRRYSFSEIEGECGMLSFRVIDLGVMVPCDQILREALAHKAGMDYCRDNTVWPGALCPRTEVLDDRHLSVSKSRGFS